MAKKSFTTQANPAMAFITEQRPTPQPAQKTPEGFKPDPGYVETKSRRMQLLVQPSLHDALKARAMAEGKSVNDLVHSILEAAVKGG